MKPYKLFIGAYDHKLGPICVNPKPACEWLKNNWDNPTGLIQDGLNTKSDNFTIKNSENLIQINKFKINDPRIRGGTLRCSIFLIVPNGNYLLPSEFFTKVIDNCIKIADDNDKNIKCQDCNDYLEEEEEKLNQKLPGSIGDGLIDHKIRDNLNSVIGYSQLLYEGVLGNLNDEQRDCIKHILNFTKELVTLSKKI